MKFNFSKDFFKKFKKKKEPIKINIAKKGQIKKIEKIGKMFASNKLSLKQTKNKLIQNGVE